MAVKKTHRIAILIIMVVTVVGTIGSFAVLILSTKNESEKVSRLQAMQDKYEEDTKAQDEQLSAKYYGKLSEYSSRVGEFDRDAVTELKSEDLVVGDGEEITSTSKLSAYYIGWNPWGKIFDQSIKDGKLGAPIPVDMTGGLITGWTEGMVGMKVGGVRELTIPADKAYGEQGRGEDIPANTPLKFIIMAIPTPEEVPMPKELEDYYMQMYMQGV